MNRKSRWLCVAAVVCTQFCTAQLAQAQFGRVNGAQNHQTTLPTDPFVTRRVSEARRRLDEGGIKESITLLQMVLSQNEDCFVPIDDKTMVSARKFSENLISENPEVLAEYRTEYGQLASVMCREGIQEKNLVKVAEVMRSYFLTEAGLDAANWLASQQLDAGNYGLAFFYLNRMTESKAHKDRINDQMIAKKAVVMALMDRREEARKLLASRKYNLGGEDWDVSTLLTNVDRGNDPGLLAVREWASPHGSVTNSTVVHYDFIKSLDVSAQHPLTRRLRKEVGEELANATGLNTSNAKPVELYPLAIGNLK